MPERSHLYDELLRGLLPCPFCGHCLELRIDEWRDTFQTCCGVCGANGPLVKPTPEQLKRSPKAGLEAAAQKWSERR